MDGELLTREETAKYLRVSVSQVDYLTRSKQLQHIRIGRRVLFNRADLAAFLRSCLVPAEG
jgi:excisionase family DNA binding protein